MFPVVVWNRSLDASCTGRRMSGRVVIGCGGNSPTAPSPAVPQIPSVAGSYSGTTTMSFPELQQSVCCFTTSVVTESGAAINVAPLVLGGQCNNVSIPVGALTY